MINDDNILLITLILSFMFFMGIGTIYTNYYNIPFGMSDIDRYTCFVGGFTIAECKPFELQFIAKHFYTMLIFTGLDSYEINYIVNILVWFVLPLCFYFFSREHMENKNIAVHTTFYFMYGCFTYFIFGFMHLTAQLTAFFFFLLSLGYFSRGNIKVSGLMGFLACLGHPYTVIFYGLLIVSYGWYHKRYDILLVGGLMGLFFLYLFQPNIINWTIFNSLRPEPSLYKVFFVFTNPLLLFFFFVGLFYKKDDVLKRYCYILLFICPFSHISRGMPFLHIFISCYGYIGLKRLINRLEIGYIIELIFILSIVMHFTNMLNVFLNLMAYEMPLRGLDPGYFKRLFLL